MAAGCVAIQHSQGYDMARGRGLVAIQNVYRDQKGA